MSITLTGTGGLFTRLGAMGKLVVDINTLQNSLPADFQSLFQQFDNQTPPGLRDVVSQLTGNVNTYINSQATWLSSIQLAAQQTLLRMVSADNPARAGSISSALTEVIAQMVAGSATVQRSTVSSTVAAISVGGDGIAVASSLGPEGLPAELIIPEVCYLTCSSASGATFQGGAKSTAGNLNWDWPGGSGASASVSIATPSSGSVVSNGSLEVYTVANQPDSFSILTGTAGTQFLQDASVYYDGTSSLQMPASATLGGLAQTLTLSPLTQYLLSFWVRTSATPSTGVLTVDLDNGSGTNVADQQSTANTIAVSLPGLTAATWTLKSVVFRTPRVLPKTVRLRIRMTTALAGGNLNLDRIILAPMTRVYNGGPSIGLHAGNTAFSSGDYWSVTNANNRGGASYNATFQALFDRFFTMSNYNLVLPSVASSPTISDSLI